MSVLLLLVCLVLVPGQLRAAPATAYTFVPLGDGIIVALDPDAETAVGERRVDGRRQAVVLSRTQPPRLLEGLAPGTSSRARAARQGRIVGYGAPAPESPLLHAFLVDGTTVRDLGLATGLGTVSAAACVTTAGEVGGYGTRPAQTTPPTPIRWRADGTADLLRTLGGAMGFVTACTASGDFVGHTATAAREGVVHATRWPAPTFAPETLETRQDVSESLVLGVSDRPEAVGMAQLHGGPQYGMSWTAQTGMVLLPPLPGDTHSVARAVNAAGDKVGMSWNPDVLVEGSRRQQAVLWDAQGRPRLLQALLAAPAPWTFHDAVGIGAHGVIAVTGTQRIPMDGRMYPQDVAGLLVPQP